MVYTYLFAIAYLITIAHLIPIAHLLVIASLIAMSIEKVLDHFSTFAMPFAYLKDSNRE